MKKFFSINNLLLIVLIAVFLVLRGPQIVKHFQMQGRSSEELGELVDIHGQVVEQEGPFALVFWATWCGPCTLELKRIGSLIEDGHIDAHRVIAISTDDNLQAVAEAVRSRGYAFPVIWDQTGLISKQYKVIATPTIIVVGQDGKIAWATNGISPLLEVRLKHYLGERNG